MKAASRAAFFLFVGLVLSLGAGCAGLEDEAESTLTSTPELRVELAGGSTRDGYRLVITGDGRARALTDDDAVREAAEFRLGCRAASLEAFDALRRASGGAVPADDKLRVELRVVPSPDRRWAIFNDTKGMNLQLVEMASGRSVPWPEDLARRVRWLVGWGPDSRRAALLVDDKDGRDALPHLAVLDLDQQTVVLELPIHPIGAGWSPDGGTLAVLTRTSHEDETPIGKLGAAIGHGDVFSDFDLELHDLHTGECQTVAIVRDSRRERGFVVWDPGATAPVIADAVNRRIPPGELPAKP